MSTITHSEAISANRTPSQPATTMNLRVYSTLTRQKEPFQTVRPGHVGMYLCGPTVYKEAHIGHMVGPVIFDCVKRYLVYCGFDVTWVVNITDVDDKLIAESNRRGISMSQVAEEMTADYLANLSAMGVDQIDQLPRATEHMDGIIAFIATLIERGYAYAADGDVFFEVGKDREYGKLSNRSAEDQQGEGGEAAARKRSAGDFALWKGAKAGEPSWESPWGPGRPGWHIECSAMSRALLGESFDIHGGGLDLMFPHHENEIAQSECCHGKPMARYWMHNGLMRASAAAGKVGGRSDREASAGGAESSVEEAAAGKISRSKGAGGLAQLIARQGGERIRFFLLRTHYRSTIVFGDEGLEEAGTALATFQRFFERFARVTGGSFYELTSATRRVEGEFEAGQNELLVQAQKHRAAFLEKMDDDFNTGGAISELFELVRLLNRYIDQQQLEEADRRDAELVAALVQGATTLKELSAVLGLFQQEPQRATGADDGAIAGLMPFVLELRTSARANKDFAMADRIRDSLTASGLALEDRKEGTHWRVEGNAAEVLEAIMALLIDVRARSRAAKDFATADRVREVLTGNGIVLEDRKGETGWRREA
jgi:cysteinyl-tRNA synthetase